MSINHDLKGFKREHPYFIGFDSDGCIFDSMEIKHKECFCPAYIKHFELQVVAKYARECWDFVNLYSKSRGCNRFLALVASLDFLRVRPEVIARQAQVPVLSQLAAWIKVETKLSNGMLKAKLDSAPTPELAQLYRWSLEVNERVEDMVHNLPPFPGVVQVLESARQRADLIVVSQTPVEALVREWQDNQIDHLIKCIAGQEQGSKQEHLAIAAVGHYAADKILMVGDAPGDYKAAKANQALFFPVVPGQEEKSWVRLRDEGLARFFAGTFAGTYQQDLLREFDAALPETPRW
jgi:phosphoglycolate phosphatase-like HAD superfamily hydrolase